MVKEKTSALTNVILCLEQGAIAYFSFTSSAVDLAKKEKCIKYNETI
jgi:hypothetical protein